MGCHGNCPGLPCRSCCTASLFCACLGTPGGRDTWWQGHLVGYKEMGLLAALGAAGASIANQDLHVESLQDQLAGYRAAGLLPATCS